MMVMLMMTMIMIMTMTWDLITCRTLFIRFFILNLKNFLFLTDIKSKEKRINKREEEEKI